MNDLTVEMIWTEIHYGGYINVEEIYWCIIDDNIFKKRFVWSRDPSKRSEPATERGSFTASLIRMALNNNCGLKC